MSIVCCLEIILAHGPELSASGLDYYQLGLAAGALPHSRILALNPALPVEELRRRLRAFLHHGNRLPVLLAALDPRRRAQNIIRLLFEEVRLNPEMLAVLDLQEALGHPDPKVCLNKALHLIRLNAAMLTRAEPIVTQELPVTTQVLVWGDSFAALKAAADLAEQGYGVRLAFPGPALQPLSPGAAINEPPGEDLLRLLTQAQEHPAIHPAAQARLLAVAGSVGNFQIRLETVEGVGEETVGAIILAPELRLEPGEAAAGAPSHPRIMTLSRLEELLGAPEEAKDLLDPEAERLRVVLLGGDSHSLALWRTLGAARRLSEQENCQVFLFLRDAKVGAPELEAALEVAAASGLIIFKLPQLPALSVDSDRPRLTFFDPIMHGEETLTCDLAVLDEVYGPAAGNAELTELLGLWPGPGGFLQGDNLRQTPVLTNRRGVYVAGPGRGPADLDQALAEAEAAVSEVQQLLGQGTATAPKGRAVIDRGRCVLCLTCHRLCPHGAISWDNRAFINELACHGCGVCASQCPNEAIQIRNFTDDQVVGALDVLDPRLTPRIITFMCQNSAWDAYLAALRLPHTNLPLGFTPVKMPCAGKVDIDYLLKAFAAGADGVLVLGCHPDNCKSQQGNEHAQWRVERAQTMLEEAGVDPRRLAFQSLAANAPQDFLAAVDRLLELLGMPQAA